MASIRNLVRCIRSGNSHIGQNRDCRRGLESRSWVFLILSGLATGASWLCYFYAIKIGDVSKVVPIDKCSLVLTIIFAVIFLGESLTWKTIAGCVLLLAGSLVMIL